MQSSAAMQQSCTHAQGNCFFPVNMEEEKEEEKKIEDDDDKITTTMLSSQQCSRVALAGHGNFYLSSERGGR